MVDYLRKKDIQFVDLDGKSDKYVLGKDEKFINIKCPFDQTFLLEKMVDCRDRNELFIECPKCGIEYSNHDLSQESLQTQLKQYLIDYSKRLERIEREKLDLEKEKTHLIKLLHFANAQSRPKCT